MSAPSCSSSSCSSYLYSPISPSHPHIRLSSLSLYPFFSLVRKFFIPAWTRRKEFHFIFLSLSPHDEHQNELCSRRALIYIYSTYACFPLDYFTSGYIHTGRREKAYYTLRIRKAVSWQLDHRDARLLKFQRRKKRRENCSLYILKNASRYI